MLCYLLMIVRVIIPGIVCYRIGLSSIRDRVALPEIVSCGIV